MLKVKNIEFSCQGYKYAPESFKSYKVIIDKTGKGNHKYELLNFTADENKRIGDIYITKGKNEAVNEIKRLYRKMRREFNSKKYCCFGFFKEGSKTEFIYIRQLRALNSNLKDKLYYYKEMKELNKENNWEYVSHVKGEMIAKDGKLEMSKGEKAIEKISKKAFKLYIAG